MISDARYANVLARRETHRSRSGAVSVVLVVLLLALVYVGIECGLAALRMPALLVAPVDALRVWRDQPAALTAVAVAVAVVGVLVIIAALTPSRLARHRIRDARSVLLVDDDVLASAVSQSVARSTGVSAAQTRTAIGRRSASIAVTPTSGRPLSRDEIDRHAADLVASLELQPPVRVRASLAESGVVGS